MALDSAQSSPSREKILVRGVNWLGDAVMTTPALQRLREARPDAEVTLLSPLKLADLWRHHPGVDQVLTFASSESAFNVAARLRNGNFGVALVLPNSIRSALEVWLARIPQRIGYLRPWRKVFLSQPIPPRVGARRMRKRSITEIKALIRQGQVAQPYPASAHHIYDYLGLVAVLGANTEPVAPSMTVTDEEVRTVSEKFGLSSDAQGPLCGLNPGAEYGPAKRWPVERFIAAANQIRRQTRCRWIIFGGKADADVAGQIAAGISYPAEGGRPLNPAPNEAVLNLAGATDLRELCALLKRCAVLLTNDTGPMHVAAALGTPVVVPFGSTSPEFTGPGLPGDIGPGLLRVLVPCAPCFRRKCPIDFRCMQNITVDAVVESVLRVMRR